MSLEYLDDIAIHDLDKKITLEQVKSALKQNPLSDWANDLWKSIANWIDIIDKGDIDPAKTQFCLYVTPAKIGKRAQALNDAKTTEEVENITTKINKELSKKKELPACSSYLQKFLNLTKEERFAIISRLKIISTDDDPLGPLRDQLAITLSPQILDLICQSAIGLAKEQADKLIREGKPAILDADKFKAEFRAFVQKNNMSGYLQSFSSTPLPSEVDSLISTRPTFVRQLELIDVKADERVRAVSDYLRASADKSKWADAGLIFERDLIDWDDNLIRQYSNINGEVADTHSNKAEKVRGRLTYRRCSQLQPTLDGQVVPNHFAHGSFNALADVQRLGWHPNYTSLLNESDQ